MLSNPDVRREVSQPHTSSDGIMRDICDGQYLKQHHFFQDHPNALQFVIYYDDIEVANALGAKAGLHKLGMQAAIVMIIN